ncbi:3-phenylpropionate/cinnamic acid dioxygenase subunit beta [Pseudomaricurvus alkylphenolicus]|uniref:3-phenylpropionate/cinnamic acid dioxygenase subunit beta n=1 Tax=Pseudomaricurvus alkylphenolicus TaxID=1306991 RepID=UPI00141E723C|nr:3-phenylpropionate/cinnamic acid dioxygenase subunit beta [Pseudomaricurvus alkylphenolicus]NIB44119.1 3-phenylpropionate/cinnamic acid dioxygenase subunit beta [Pseudomaricurvus alkylphenolicus]
MTHADDNATALAAAELKTLLEPTPLPMLDTSKRISAADPLHTELMEFLVDEAEMLDNLQFKAWGATLAEDLEYNAPLRRTRTTRQQDQTVVRTVQHLHEDFGSMQLRIMRVADTTSAWGEDPPSRTRRFISNIRAYRTEQANEYLVRSYELVTRSRFDFDDFDLIPCERYDILRRDGVSFKLARREILLDQVVVGTPNLGIFL